MEELTSKAFKALDKSFKRSHGNDFCVPAWIVTDFSTDECYRVVVITHNEEYDDVSSKFLLSIYVHDSSDFEPSCFELAEKLVSGIDWLIDTASKVLGTEQKALRSYRQELIDKWQDESFPINSSLKGRDYDADDSDRFPLMTGICDQIRSELGEAFLQAWLYACEYLASDIDDQFKHLRRMIGNI